MKPPSRWVLSLAALLLSAGIVSAEDDGPFAGDRETEQALEREWKGVMAATKDDRPARRKREWKMCLTTWLPDQWPPTRKTVWTRYAYGLDVSMDGASDVSAPFARVEQKGEPRRNVVVPMARRLQVIAVHPVRPHAGWHYTREDEKHMLDIALALRGAPAAGARGGIGVKSYFQSWRLGNAEIAAHVAPGHRGFFKWLDEK